MNIEDLYSLYSKNYLVDTDTRTIRPNSIFFSLKGDNFNGNAFVKKAIELGASYCVIDEAKYEIEGVTILVNNVLETLQSLATYHRQKLGIPIIGITGSNGKTTTKELILAVLKTQFKATATQGNLNNHIGVPLTLLSFTNETEIGIVEMGANHQKEIEFLSNICEPDIGCITNFGKAHLEGFGGIGGVIKGKSELYTYLEKENKIVFVNSNDTIQVELTKKIKRILLNNSITISSIQPFLELKYTNKTILTNLVGTYNLDNIRVAISIGEYFNISTINISTAISNYSPTNNRSQVLVKNNNKILMDAYNANPTSTLAALYNFNKIKETRKVVILGDMFELGEDSIKEHQHIVNICENLEIDRFIFIGKNYYETTAEEKYDSVESMKKQLNISTFKNNYILIKGSRGMALERLLDLID
jgi:UDP-N-acetylmuramoyl-tripeptide--D-alanyl-D-alanine ligase